MSTTLHSFMDIFETTIEDGDISVQLNKIVIPLIQRDYAQGRIDKDINRVCDIICYRNGQSPQGYSSDVFDLLHLYFSADDEKAVANIATLESFFDCWCNIKGYNNPTEFLESFMSYTHAREKIVVDSRYKIDVFEDCLHFSPKNQAKI